MSEQTRDLILIFLMGDYSIRQVIWIVKMWKKTRQLEQKKQSLIVEQAMLYQRAMEKSRAFGKPNANDSSVARKSAESD